MASPGELVRTIAEVLGVPEATVTVLDRNLVVAGLRTKRGRGPSAAEVTTLDGARLLIAGILSPAPVTSTAEVVGWYSQLVAKPVPWRTLVPHQGPGDFYGADDDTWRDCRNLPNLGRLPAGHRFDDALAALMEDAYHMRRASLPEVMVSLYRPIPYARIEVDGAFRQWVAYYDPNIPTHADNIEALWDTDDYIKDKYGVLNKITVETRQSVGFDVISEIAAALSN
jgi:hypothetical protein